MKTNRTDNGNTKKANSRLLAAFAVSILLSTLFFGEGCSSRHAMMTAPYDTVEQDSNQIDPVDYSVNETSDDTDSESHSMSQAANNVAGEVFKISNMLFDTVDSLNALGK